MLEILQRIMPNIKSVSEVVAPRVYECTHNNLTLTKPQIRNIIYVACGTCDGRWLAKEHK